MHARALGLALVASLTVAVPLAAQQGTAELGGKVTDQQGGVLPGVAIVVTNEDTGVFREVVSTPDGSYFVSQIVPGRYRVTLPAIPGFRPVDPFEIDVPAGDFVTKTVELTRK